MGVRKLITKTLNKKGVPVYALAEQPKAKSRTEDMEAIDFYSHVKYQMPELGSLFFHVANESQSAPQYRKKVKQMGLTSGVADYLCLAPRGGCPYAAIELKRARKKDSSVSAEQTAFLKEAEAEGAFVAICYGYKSALYALREYLSK